MALKIFKNKGETNSIPINANNLNYNFTEILNLVYPIGRGFIDFTDTDYSNYLGFSWKRELIGMTPIGLNVNDNDFNAIGKTGGEKKHTLTLQEMPTHNHMGKTYSKILTQVKQYLGQGLMLVHILMMILLVVYGNIQEVKVFLVQKLQI